jgi:chromate reductase
MENIRVLAVCGSLRKGSYNLKLMGVAVKAALAAGVKVTEVDLKALGLPVYDGDIEAEWMPESVTALAEMVKACDVLLIASPEYNYSVSGALKNAIDWVSRVKPNPFSGKFAAIFGASTGPFGTVRGQNQLRQILSCVNVSVTAQPQVMVALADTAFEADGKLKNPLYEKNLKELLAKTFESAHRMK